MTDTLYRPPLANLWTGRTDTEEAHTALRWHQQMQCLDLGDSSRAAEAAGKLTLLGFACDAGVKRNKGRPGAAAGPDALRAALANGICDDETFMDAGNVACVGDDLEAAQATLANQLQTLIAQGAKPVVLGGGHEVAWASFQGLIPRLQSGRQRLGIINFDAHLDLRTPKPAGSSGTPFRQIAQWCEVNQQPFHYLVLGVNPSANTTALFDYAQEKQVQWLTDWEMEANPIAETFAYCEKFLAQVDALYITVCLDVFNAAFAPGVSAPAAAGISPARMLQVFTHLLVRAQALGKTVWLLDVAELNPTYDPHSQTAKLGARIIWEYYHASRQPKSESPAEK